jgi:ribosome-binding protein aMBF1 (putative translation factor)
MRRSQREEPLTITLDVVVSELERHGCERMAAYVRDLGNGVANANRRRQWAEDDLAKALERLHVHEPPQKPRTDCRNGKPTEMSDG